VSQVEKEIEELEALLERKKQEKEALLIERQSHERLIDQSRGKYRDQIVKLEKEMDKVQRDEDKNTREADEQRGELADLQDYEEKFKARLKSY
jgi:hypothetical protein